MNRRHSKQLTFNLIAEEPGAWIECRGLFSSSYLRNHVAQADFFPKPEEVRDLYDSLRTLWSDNYVKGGKRLVGYDNAEQKGYHRHFLDKEEPYPFVSIWKLIDDFRKDVEALRGGRWDED